MKRILLIFVFFFSIEAFSEAACGKLLNALLKYDPATNKVTFDQFFFTTEEFCDRGKEEVNANFEIVFYDKGQKVMNQKSVFMNTSAIVEIMHKKDKTKFEKAQELKSPQYRNVKFEVGTTPDMIANYKIFSKADKTVFGEGAVR